MSEYLSVLGPFEIGVTAVVVVGVVLVARLVYKIALAAALEWWRGES